MRSFVSIAFVLSTIGIASAQIEFEAGDLSIEHVFAATQPESLGSASEAEPYSNVLNYTGQVSLNGLATNQSGNFITRLVADDITPLPGFGGQDVTSVTFSVANLNSIAVAVRARIRFWLADGAGGGPGTYYANPAPVGFTFNAMTFAPNSVTTVTGTIGAGVWQFTNNPFWAGITFDNNTGATGATPSQLNNFGQGIFDPPTTGSSQDIFFRTTAAGSFFAPNNPAGSLLNFGGTPRANFGWRFRAVPEPASILLLAIGSLGMLRRRRLGSAGR